MNLTEILQTFNSLGRRQAEISSYNWFLEKRNENSIEVNRVDNNIMLPGKIHIFNYNPKHADKLSYYDRHPVVLYIGTITRGKHILELGINLNFVPNPYKIYLLNAISSTYSGFFNQVNTSKVPKSALTQPIIKYNYNALKTMLEQYGFKFAIRTYIPSRKSNTYVVNYSNWQQVSFMSIQDFEGITYEQMVNLFKTNKK